MSSTLFLFLVANNVSSDERDKYWVINAISGIVGNIIFCVEFLVNRFGSKKSAYDNPYSMLNE